MKNYIYLIGLFVILFLSGCANPYTIIEEQKREIEELNNQIKELNNKNETLEKSLDEVNVELRVQQEKNTTKQENRDLLSQCFNDAKKKSAESILYWIDYQEKNCNNYGYVEVELLCKNSVSESIEKAKKEELDAREECLKIYPQ